MKLEQTEGDANNLNDPAPPHEDTSQQEAPPPDHEPPPGTPVDTNEHEAEPQTGPITPIPADDELEAETDQGIVMLMVAHGVGPAATDRDDAIAQLKAHRDAPVLPIVPDAANDGILAVLAKDAEAVVAEVEKVASEAVIEVEHVAKAAENIAGKVWNHHLQAWV